MRVGATVSLGDVSSVGTLGGLGGKEDGRTCRL